MRARIASIIALLREEIEHHGELYYVECEPVITDEEYDFLVEELARIEAVYPESVTTDSPTQKVGSDLRG
jgi:DNA ligase (NAD+)